MIPKGNKIPFLLEYFYIFNVTIYVCPAICGNICCGIIYTTGRVWYGELESSNMNRVRNLASECAVLLENDGTLPIASPCSVALYGTGARYTVKGGTGSGDVNSRFEVSIEEGLEAAGVVITTKGWLDRYDEAKNKHFEE